MVETNSTIFFEVLNANLFKLKSKEIPKFMLSSRAILTHRIVRQAFQDGTVTLIPSAMKTRAFLFSTVFFSFFTPVFSQPYQQWAAFYNPSGVDQLYDMTVDDSGNVYVTGASVISSPTTDYFTIKYSSAGVEQWKRSYNGVSSSEDRAFALAVDHPGNVFVTGSTGYDRLIVTIKYNTLGDTQWIRSYNGPRNVNNYPNDYPTDIFVDDSGYVYVAGTSEGPVGPNNIWEDYTTIKYSPAGVQQWVKRYDGPSSGADVVNSLTVDPSGNVYITGRTWGGSGSAGSKEDITTIKYNSLGTLQWMKTYNGIGNSSDEGTMIKVDDVGNVYVTGYTTTDSSTDIITIKYNAAGTELWKKFYDGPDKDTDEGAALAVDALHNVYVTGRSDFGITNKYDMLTLKYDSAGNQIWIKSVNGSSNGNDVSEEIVLDDTGNVYVLGTTVNTTTVEDYQFIKYNPAGIQQWSTKFTSFGSIGGQDYAAALFLDASNNMYLAGMSTQGYAVIKYGHINAVEKIHGRFPVTIFPNPSAGIFNVKTANTVDRIEVFNMLGKNVYTQAGLIHLNSAEIDLSQAPKGMYFLRMISLSGDKIFTGKILLD